MFHTRLSFFVSMVVISFCGVVFLALFHSFLVAFQRIGSEIHVIPSVEFRWLLLSWRCQTARLSKGQGSSSVASCRKTTWLHQIKNRDLSKNVCYFLPIEWYEGMYYNVFYMIFVDELMRFSCAQILTNNGTKCTWFADTGYQNDCLFIVCPLRLSFWSFWTMKAV